MLLITKNEEEEEEEEEEENSVCQMIMKNLFNSVDISLFIFLSSL